MATLAFRAERHDLSRLKALVAVFILGCAPLATMLVSWLPTAEKAGPALLLVKAFALPFLAAVLILIAVTLSCPEARRVVVTAPRMCKAAALALMVIATVNAFFVAPEPVQSVARTAILAVHLLFGISVYRLVKAGLVGLASLTQALTAGFLLSLAALLLFAWEVRHLESFNWLHDLPGYVNIRNLSYYAAPMAALILARFSLEQSPGQRLWTFACSATALAVIFWSGSRGGIAALGCAYVATALFCPRLRSTAAWLPALLACLVGGLAAHAIDQGLEIGQRMEGMGLERMARLENFSTGRIDLWLSSMDPVRERLLFGHGEGQTIHVVPYATEHRVFSPHNIFIQTLLAWGVVGTLLIAGLGGALARRVATVLRTQDGEAVPLALALAVTLSYSLIDGTLNFVLSTGIFAACAGALLAAACAGENRSSSSW